MDLSKYKHLLSNENTIDCTTNFSNLLAHVKNINNEDEFCKEEVCSIVNNINQLLETIIEKGSLSDYAPLLEFVKARLKLTLVKKQARKYSNKLITVSFLWQMTSPKLYETLKELFILPSVRRIQQLSSVFAENVEGLNRPYLEARLKALSETEKLVILTCEEIHTEKRLEYFNGSVFGMTENGEIAKTVLCFMVQSLCCKYKDVVGLTAVAGLNPYVTLLAVSMDTLSTNRVEGKRPREKAKEISKRKVEMVLYVVIAIYIIISEGAKNKSKRDIGESIKCVDCVYDRNGDPEECLNNPPPAIECGQRQTKCFTAFHYNDQRELTSVRRFCDFREFSDECAPYIEFNGTFFNKYTRCMKSCSSDGCNTHTKPDHLP